MIIYDSHIEAVCTQIKRIPYAFPTLTISDELNDIDNGVCGVCGVCGVRGVCGVCGV